MKPTLTHLTLTKALFITSDLRAEQKTHECIHVKASFRIEGKHVYPELQQKSYFQFFLGVKPYIKIQGQKVSRFSDYTRENISMCIKNTVQDITASHLHTFPIFSFKLLLSSFHTLAM